MPSDTGGSNIIGYYITISPPPSLSCITGTCSVSGDTLQYTFAGLDHTQEYNISVAAINCAGTGSTTQLQPNLDINATGTYRYLIFIIISCIKITCLLVSAIINFFL